MKKLLLITSTVIVCLFTAGKVLDKNYKNYWWPFFNKLDVLLKDSSYYDGIYLGNSRTHFGINPYYIDSITSLNTYNMGMGGGNINEINFIANSYLRKHPAPLFAVISIGYSGITQVAKSFENPCYYFFYMTDTLTNQVLANYNYHTSLYKLFPVLKYTSFDDFNKFSIAENFKGKTILRPGGIAYKGFINNSVNMLNPQLLEKNIQKDTICQPGIAMLEETIILFKNKKTIPILVYPPSSIIERKIKAPVEVKIDSAIQLLSKKYHIPVLHYDTDSSFSNTYFTDAVHLNIQGTIIYSRKIGSEIFSILNKKTLVNKAD